MLHMKRRLLVLTLLGLSAAAAQAAPITTVVSANGNGGNYGGSLSVLNDGIFPTEASQWNLADKVSWNGKGNRFVFAFGDLYRIDSVRLSVDNNDGYLLEYSTDYSAWASLLTVSSGVGEIGWGMDTMATDPSDPEHVSQLAFTPREARYVRIQATDGDNSYSIGEVAFTGERADNGSTNPVPEPAGLALIALGLAGMGLARRRRV